MKQFLKFMVVGSFFSTVEEFLTVLLIKHDIAGYIFTLLLLFPAFLTFVWISRLLIEKLIHREPLQDLVHYFLYGFIGLFIEWFLIGLAPWSNPGANPVFMLLFQLGMFSFWTSVAFMPQLFISRRELSRQIRKSALRFYVPYFVLVYLLAFSVPETLKFVTIIPSIIFGYLFLNVFYWKYFLRSLSQGPILET